MEHIHFLHDCNLSFKSEVVYNLSPVREADRHTSRRCRQVATTYFHKNLKTYCMHDHISISSLHGFLQCQWLKSTANLLQKIYNLFSNWTRIKSSFLTENQIFLLYILYYHSKKLFFKFNIQQQSCFLFFLEICQYTFLP